MRLSEKMGTRMLDGMVIFYLSQASHWLYPLKDNLANLEKQRVLSAESGDLTYQSYALINDIFTRLFIGQNLAEIKEICSRHTLFFIKEKNDHVYFDIWKSAVAALLGETVDPLAMKGEVFDEIRDVPSFYQNKVFNAVGFYNTAKLLILNLHEKWKEAVDLGRTGEKVIVGVMGFPVFSWFYFYYGLALAGYFREAPAGEKKEILKKLSGIIKKYSKWAESAPSNYRHKYSLLKAELLRIQNNDLEAEKEFLSAMQSAREYQYTNDEAMIYEAAFRFYNDRGMHDVAGFYLRKAWYGYQIWGVKAKLNALHAKYSQTLLSFVTDPSADTANPSMTMVNTITSTGNRSADFLDLGSVIKVSQTISGEIEMDQLLTSAIQILIENTGAEKGVLLLLKDGDLWIEGEGGVTKDSIQVLKSILLEQSGSVSAGIVRYVMKKREPLVLNDAVREGLFTKDPYVIENKIRSVLCVPIIYRGELMGAVYLENNLAQNTFTMNRVEMINLLTAQIAISIQNAHYLDEMKEKVRLKEEMSIAERIQTSLLPELPLHEEIEIAAKMVPAEEVGGDYYDFLIGKDGTLWAAVGDASGHGVTPGLIMMMTQTALNTKLLDQTLLSPKDVVNSVNEVLTRNIRKRLKNSHFMTLTVMQYLGKGRVVYAGLHLDLIVYRAKTGQIELFKTQGIYLGMRFDIKHITENAEIQLESGDLLVLYTDGMIEARQANNRNELWGIERLCEVVRKNQSESCSVISSQIIEASLQFSGNVQEDDMTAVVMRRK